jgi:hypothetical protein
MRLAPLTWDRDECTLLPSEERTDTIFMLHKLCHSAPQTLACESQPPLESSFVQLILCILQPARLSQGRLYPRTTHKILSILGKAQYMACYQRTLAH